MPLPADGGGLGLMKAPYTMSGKCGGWVFQNSRHGQIFYPLKAPFNPRSLDQIRVRDNFAGVAKGWRPLGDWQRGLWDAEAARKKTRKRLGQCGPMTGWNYWLQVNVRRVNRGLAPLELPPEYLQRLQAASATAIATVFLTRPLLGPALFLQANRLLLTENASPVRFPAGLPPPRSVPEPAPALAS
jgi:hypothetical protein